MRLSPKLPLQSFRLQNFKAVRDSGSVTFTPLTVLIGNNGSGKSSLVEGLETFTSIARNGLDAAMQQWYGFEHIQNRKAKRKLLQTREGLRLSDPIRFVLRGQTSYGNSDYYAFMEINEGEDEFDGNIFFQREKCRIKGVMDVTRNSAGEVNDLISEKKWQMPSDISVLAGSLIPFLLEWQFLSMVPQAMWTPKPRKRTGGRIQLVKDGSNIAEYLLYLRHLDKTHGTSTLDGIIETLQYVIPYAEDVQPAITSELEKNVYLQLSEADFKIPGWLLSTGTLRILTLLAVLRNPNPPSLLVIEEIENGLDPRTINLVVEEIRAAVESGRTQVVITTHSPYLLDLLSLSQIVLVERDDNGTPVFTRPGDQEALKKWAEKFSPGRLYTMNQLGRSANS